MVLVDASNAFNSLYRSVACHNFRVLRQACPTFAFNMYRAPARLFVTGGEELISAEGTRQGDPLAVCMYALSLQPLTAHI